MFELRTFPGVGHLVTSGETQSCREWKISRTTAMNTQTQNASDTCTSETALCFGHLFTRSADTFF